MNKIYNTVGELRDVFMGIASQYTKNKYESEDAVQMLSLYFLKMDKKTLRRIWDKDGRKGLIRYGAVALRRSFTSKRSEYYYTYKKYGVYIDSDTPPASHAGKTKLSLDGYNEKSTWEYFEKMDLVLDDMYWYDSQVYKLYYNIEGETLDTLSKKTKISRNSLFTTISNVRKHLKKVLSKKENEED